MLIILFYYILLQILLTRQRQYIALTHLIILIEVSMSLNCGIVGLPNVGKSTIFKALTNHHAVIENYPFSTIEPNIARLNVHDKRLVQISQITKSKQIIPASVEFIDIAGLVKGASKGEGLGNQFLGHIRQVNAIFHVIRCFDDVNITHVHETPDPISDIEIVELELILADLEVIEKKLKNLQNAHKCSDKESTRKNQQNLVVLEQLKKKLCYSNLELAWINEVSNCDMIRELNLISLKPRIYVCNIDDSQISKDCAEKVSIWAQNKKSKSLNINGFQAVQCHSLHFNEKSDNACEQLIKESYRLLDLITFFTKNKNEVRAWEIKKGTSAQKAAGKIHSDMERGFIRAEIISSHDLVQLLSEEKVREAGKVRIEGKNYQIQDGDIMNVRFNI